MSGYLTRLFGSSATPDDSAVGAVADAGSGGGEQIPDAYSSANATSTSHRSEEVAATAPLRSPRVTQPQVATQHLSTFPIPDLQSESELDSDESSEDEGMPPLQDVSDSDTDELSDDGSDDEDAWEDEPSDTDVRPQRPATVNHTLHVDPNHPSRNVLPLPRLSVPRNPFPFPTGGQTGGPVLHIPLEGFFDVLRGIRPDEDEVKEDKEQAKTLIGALPEVSKELLERLGKAGEEEDGMCPICYEKFLDDTNWARNDESPDTMSSFKVVSMPCAHIFHSACLIPWFSKPRQTTCPTCRFDIDPWNLTASNPRPEISPDADGNPADIMMHFEALLEGHPDRADLAESFRRLADSVANLAAIGGTVPHHHPLSEPASRERINVIGGTNSAVRPIIHFPPQVPRDDDDDDEDEDEDDLSDMPALEEMPSTRPAPSQAAGTQTQPPPGFPTHQLSAALFGSSAAPEPVASRTRSTDSQVPGLEEVQGPHPTIAVSRNNVPLQASEPSSGVHRHSAQLPLPWNLHDHHVGLLPRRSIPFVAPSTRLGPTLAPSAPSLIVADDSSSDENMPPLESTSDSDEDEDMPTLEESDVPRAAPEAEEIAARLLFNGISNTGRQPEPMRVPDDRMIADQVQNNMQLLDDIFQRAENIINREIFDEDDEDEDEDDDDDDFEDDDFLEEDLTFIPPVWATDDNPGTPLRFPGFGAGAPRSAGPSGVRPKEWNLPQAPGQSILEKVEGMERERLRSQKVPES